MDDRYPDDRHITVEENRIRLRKWKMFFAAALLACFAVLAFLVETGRTAGFDHRVDFFVYSLRNPAANRFYAGYTQLASPKGIIGLILLLILIPKTRKKVGLPLGCTSLVIFLFYRVLKLSFARPRPDVALRLVTEHGYSFPSGHSMNGLVCYGMLLWLILRLVQDKKKRFALSVVFMTGILLIGFSRIYLGVHYVTDVIGGFLMGLAMVLIATEVIPAVERKVRK